MSGGLFRRLFTRHRTTTAPPLSPQVSPPPPPPAPIRTITPAAVPEELVVPAASAPQVRLMMADGSIEDLPADPELSARASYLVRSMLSPAPPPPVDPQTPPGS